MRPTIALLLLTTMTNAQSLEFQGFASGPLFQLADPVLDAPAVFFANETQITLSQGYDDVTIRYTLDGSEPSDQSPIYQKPILVKQSGELNAKAFHPTCRPSNTIGAKFFKINKNPPVKSIRLAGQPSEKYPGTGAPGLVDLRKGSSNFHENRWMGFNGSDLEAVMELEPGFAFGKVTASVLSDPGSWIFPPSALEVFVSENGRDFHKIALQEMEAPSENTPTGPLFLSVNFTPQKSPFVKVVLKNIPAIPDWHPGKGTPAWLFVDEVLMNDE